MDKRDKELFLFSALSGFFTAITFIMNGGIKRAQEQQKRALEDARTRFEHAQNYDAGRD
jgi:hypothetical protein